MTASSDEMMSRFLTTTQHLHRQMGTIFTSSNLYADNYDHADDTGGLLVERRTGVS